MVASPRQLRSGTLSAPTVRVRPKAFRRPSQWGGEAGVVATPAQGVPGTDINQPVKARLRLAPAHRFGVFLLVSVVGINLLAYWALSRDMLPQDSAAAGWIEGDALQLRARQAHAPVTVFSAPLAERRTARYLSMDALDAVEAAAVAPDDAPPPEAAR